MDGLSPQDSQRDAGSAGDAGLTGDADTGGRRGLLIALALSLLFVVLYGINFRTTLTGDSVAHLYQAASLRWSGDLTLDEYRAGILAQGGGQLPYFVTRTHDHLRSVFNFLPAVLLLPVFSMASWICGPDFAADMRLWGLAGKVMASLFILGAGWMLWLLIRRRVSTEVAALVLAAYWFGSPLWPVSIDYSQNQPLQFFKLAALLALFGTGRDVRPRFFWAGMLLAASVLCRYQTLFSAGAIVAMTILHHFRERRLFLLFLGGAALAPLGAAYHWIAFGSPFARGPSLYQAFDAPLLLTSLKLLINPSKGMLIHSPWTAFAILGPLILLPKLRGRSPGRQIILTCAASAVPTVMLYSKTNGWAGGWCWGYRYLMDILPEIALIFALVLERGIGMRWMRMTAWAAVAAGCGFQAVGALAYDNQWHAVFDSGFHREAWLWQVRDSEIPFYARRGVVYLGGRPHPLREDPYASRGLHEPADWGGRKMVWTSGKARFFRIALENPATIHLFPSPAATAQNPLQVTVSGPRINTRTVTLRPGETAAVEIPEIPFLLGAMIEIEVDRTFEETPGGRRLGVAIPFDEISYRGVF